MIEPEESENPMLEELFSGGFQDEDGIIVDFGMPEDQSDPNVDALAAMLMPEEQGSGQSVQVPALLQDGASFGMMGDEWHGPEAPGPGWVQVRQGERGGKVWKQQADQGQQPATAPRRQGQAQVARKILVHLRRGDMASALKELEVIPSEERTAILNRLPPTEKQALLQHQRGAVQQVPSPAPAARPQTPALLQQQGEDFDPSLHFPRLVEILRERGGRHNIASLVEVRQALSSLSRIQQDNLIREARRRGLVTGSTYEGRHGISPEERAAGIQEPNEPGLIGFLHLKNPAGASFGPVPEPSLGPIEERASLVAEILYGLYGENAVRLVQDEAGMAFGMVGDEWHGPTPPGEGWIQIRPGPRGGKRWKRSSQQTEGTPEPSGQQQKAPAQETGGFKQPRGAGGRFIPMGTGEAGEAARRVIGEILSGRGQHDAKTVAGHLAILNVQQLRELHQQHGQRIPGRLREQLVQGVLGRIQAIEKEQKTAEQKIPESQEGKTPSPAQTKTPEIPAPPPAPEPPPSLVEEPLQVPPNLDVQIDDEAREKMHDLFGKRFIDGLVATAANAVEGAKVTVKKSGRSLVVNTDVDESSPGSRDHMQATRTFSMNRGKVSVHNDIFELGSDSPLRGKGVEIFLNQVKALRALGVSSIRTMAAGSFDNASTGSGFNGYYTWPRFGYDATIPRRKFETIPAPIRGKMGNSQSILKLFSIPGGKEWWELNGHSINMKFDLSDGSKSMKALEAYVEERKSRPATPKRKREGSYDPNKTWQQREAEVNAARERRRQELEQKINDAIRTLS